MPIPKGSPLMGFIYESCKVSALFYCKLNRLLDEFICRAKTHHLLRLQSGINLASLKNDHGVERT